MNSDKTKQSITHQLSELEAIIRWFESQKEVDVEKGLIEVRRGAEIILKLRDQLKKTQNEFEEIKKSLEEDLE